MFKIMVEAVLAGVISMTFLIYQTNVSSMDSKIDALMENVVRLQTQMDYMQKEISTLPRR